MNKIKIKDIFNSNQETIKLSNCDFINYLDTSSITTNRIDNVQYLNVKNDIIPSRAKRNVKKNTIVYSSVRPNLKHYGIIRKPLENMVASTGFVTLDIKDETQNNADYMYYNLTQNKYTDYLHTIACNNVSSYPSINPSDIENMEIEIEPDIDKQKQIAKLFVDIDNKIELNNIINEKLEKLAKTLYEYWFVQFDFPNENKRPYKSSGGNMIYNEKLKREIPLGWEVKQIGNIIQEQDKSSVQVNQANNIGKYPFFTSGNDVLKYDEYFVDDMYCYLSTGGNACVKYYYGKASYSTDTWCISANEYSFYLYNYLISINNQIDKLYFAGTGLKHLQKDIFKNSYIVIPASNIIEEYNNIVSNGYKMSSKNYLENQELAIVRDYLLPLLMNGQISIIV